MTINDIKVEINNADTKKSVHLRNNMDNCVRLQPQEGGVDVVLAPSLCYVKIRGTLQKLG